jgi:rhodanese-related sulfurtransferase
MRIAKGMGYLKAQSLGGGLSSWRAASLPVEKG